jgi:hypothetical protein
MRYDHQVVAQEGQLTPEPFLLVGIRAFAHVAEQARDVGLSSKSIEAKIPCRSKSLFVTGTSFVVHAGTWDSKLAIVGQDAPGHRVILRGGFRIIPTIPISYHPSSPHSMEFPSFPSCSQNAGVP